MCRSDSVNTTTGPRKKSTVRNIQQDMEKLKRSMKFNETDGNNNVDDFY